MLEMNCIFTSGGTKMLAFWGPDADTLREALLCHFKKLQTKGGSKGPHQRNFRSIKRQALTLPTELPSRFSAEGSLKIQKKLVG